MEFKSPTHENIRHIVQTMCDCCGGPIAARSMEELLKRFDEYGWKVTDDDRVICDRCVKSHGGA